MLWRISMSSCVRRLTDRLSPRRSVGLLLVTIGFLGSLAGTARAAEPPRVFDLGKPAGSLASYSIALTASGRVTGLGLYKRLDPYFPEYNRAFSWTAASGMVDIGTLGGDFVYVNAVSASGQVVGWSTESGTFPARAFSWTPEGGMEDLGTLGGTTSLALAVSSAGHVVGQSETASGEYHAFLWTESDGMVDLGALSGGYSTPRAVNDAGQVVGESRLANGFHHAFSWTSAGGMIDLDEDVNATSSAAAVNASGQVVGIRTTFGPGTSSFANAAFSWTVTGGRIDMNPLHAGGHSQADTLSSDGLVIGRATTADGGYHAFAWTPPGPPVDLGALGGKHSMPSAVNASGQVIGQANPTFDTTHAFSWTAAGGMTDIGTLGGSYSWPTALNETGQVVGISAVPGFGQRAFSWTPGGEIAELPMLGGRDSSAIAVNASGQIAGSSQTVNSATHAVFWSTPGQYIGDLIAGIQDLQDAGVINGGNANALITKLEGALAKIDAGQPGPAVNKLEAFVSQVQAFVNTGKLTAAQGQPLIDGANAIIAALTS